jgi:hypothetical protein
VNLDVRTPVARRDFLIARRALAGRLYRDPSYGVFDAMTDMGRLTEEYVQEVVVLEPGQALWVGGSLGRREMLPNSDLDLFVLHDGKCQIPETVISGLDKVDFGQLLLNDAVALLETTLVDANRLIDGRPLGACVLGEVLTSEIERTNTPDRQLSNLLAEYAYFHWFDFQQKRTSCGPNLKYSSGSARVTLFFDFVHRYRSGAFPAQRSGQPELEEALLTAEPELHRRAPRRSIEIVLLVKCAAISIFDATGDPRVRYVSRWALSLIHEICQRRFDQWQLRRVDDLVNAYGEARREIEATIDNLIDRLLGNHPCHEGFRRVAKAPIEHRATMGAQLAEEAPEWRRSFLTYSAWQLTLSSPPASLVRALADDLMDRPVVDAWGGLMAVACSPTADDETLRRLVTWLADNEPGAYLAKLVSRNPLASSRTRQLAYAGYASREAFREIA